MLIPTEEQFTEAMRALVEPIPNCMLESFPVQALHVNDRDLVRPHAVEIMEWLAACWNRASELPALSWLANDRMASLAMKGLTRRWRRTDEHYWTERIILHLPWRFEAHDGHPEYYPSELDLRWTKIQAAVDSALPEILIWRFGLLWALREYHHKPQTASGYLSSYKKALELKEKIVAGFEAQRELNAIFNDEIFKPHLFPIPSGQYQLDRMKRGIDRMVGRIEGMQSALPIKRNDSTAKERLLIYRLWQISRAMSPIWEPPHLRKNLKPSVIQCVLLTPGVENQIDERNIEKMCARFKQDRRPRMPFRHLVDELRGSNYREEMAQKAFGCRREPEERK